MKPCATKKCKNKVKRSGYCRSCHIKHYRERNNLRYSYQCLKDNAKRRGKIFELTFEQFSSFAVETDYMKKKGIFAKNMHIDRKKETEGYTIDNIQLLTNSQNIKKYLTYVYNEKTKRMDFHTKTSKPAVQGDCPF